MRAVVYRRAIACLLGSALGVSPVSAELAWAQANIGNAQIVVNDVRGTVGKTQPATLRAGIDVFQDEVIRTGSLSASKVVFQDSTSLAVGASSDVTLDRFVFDPDPAKSQVALSIARGVVRFTTGSLPKSAYKITTPSATIGVRGTILTISVAADGTTIVTVDEGIAIVTGAAQTISVNAGSTTIVGPHVPPAPPAASPPTPPPVSQMDTLLADSTHLAAGPAAGGAAAGLGITPVAIGLAAAALALGVGLSAGGDNNQATTTGTGNGLTTTGTGTTQ